MIIVLLYLSNLVGTVGGIFTGELKYVMSELQRGEGIKKKVKSTQKQSDSKEAWLI